MGARRYPGSMEGTSSISGGANFSIDEEEGKNPPRRVPRTRRASLASEYVQVAQEIEDASLIEVEENRVEEDEAEPDLMEEQDEESLLTDIPEATKQRIHQSLIQELGKLEFPQPRSTWEAAILELIEPQIHILIQAELRRVRASLEEQVNASTFQSYAEQIAAQITPGLEDQIRQKMWVEFEEILRQRDSSTDEQE